LQPVRVRPEELSVRLGSYPGGGKGDRLVEALEKEAREGGLASVRAATRVKSEQAPKG
jgi:N-acetylglutamate synthase-like GNAT family acetyltransferase